MPKQNFINVPVSDTTAQIFDAFVKEKDTTKTAALTDMLDLYMLAMDEELYLKLKKEFLRMESVKEMVLSKDYELIDDGSEFSTYLFMKLSNVFDRFGNSHNGMHTIDTYIEDEKKRGYTWFSTESLYYGMSQKRVRQFNQEIERGNTVKIYFAIGQDAGGTNNIHYSADVLEIVSNTTPENAPSKDYPQIWKSKARIWIKLRNIQPENNITVDDLIVQSTGTPLRQVISTSQYHFGYVTRK